MNPYVYFKEYKVFILQKEALLGAVQNHADRKTNFFFIKYFQSSRIQGLTSFILGWGGESEYHLLGIWTLD